MWDVLAIEDVPLACATSFGCQNVPESHHLCGDNAHPTRRRNKGQPSLCRPQDLAAHEVDIATPYHRCRVHADDVQATGDGTANFGLSQYFAISIETGLADG